MRTVAVVPMKLNNERLPNKNTKRFSDGSPLCKHILETLLKISDIDEVYVYCSNPIITDFIPDRVTFLRRSSALDSSETTMNEVLEAFAKDVPSDIYVMSHATSPFIKQSSIEEGLRKVKSGLHDSSLAVEVLQEFLWHNNAPFNYDLDNIARTQDLEKMYKETSGFYIYRHELINEHSRRVGFNPYLKEVSKIEGMDVDELIDFEIADAINNTR